MSSGTLFFVAFLAFTLVSLGGLFVYGWRRRKDKMPKVAPLPKNDKWDEDWD